MSSLQSGEITNAGSQFKLFKGHRLKTFKSRIMKSNFLTSRVTENKISLSHTHKLFTHICYFNAFTSNLE